MGNWAAAFMVMSEFFWFGVVMVVLLEWVLEETSDMMMMRGRFGKKMDLTRVNENCSD